MNKTLVAKVTVFLNEEGEFTADLTGPARKTAEFICSIVKSVIPWFLTLQINKYDLQNKTHFDLGNRGRTA